VATGKGIARNPDFSAPLAHRNVRFQTRASVRFERRVAVPASDDGRLATHRGLAHAQRIRVGG
jgi:hypothetical protein